MSASPDYVQVAADASGKKIGNYAALLPAGSAVTDSAGNVTYLATATTVFLQRVVLSDSSGNELTSLAGEDRQQEIIDELRELRRVVCASFGQLFVDTPGG